MLPPSSLTCNYVTLHSRNTENRWSFTSERSFTAAAPTYQLYVAAVPDSSAPIRGCGTARRLGRCHESGSAMTSRATMGERSIPGFAVRARGRSGALSLSLSPPSPSSLSLARSLSLLSYAFEISLRSLSSSEFYPRGLQKGLVFDGINKGDFAVLRYWLRFVSHSTMNSMNDWR